MFNLANLLAFLILDFFTFRNVLLIFGKCLCTCDKFLLVFAEVWQKKLNFGTLVDILLNICLRFGKYLLHFIKHLLTFWQIFVTFY